jgi:hypothetical protein
MFRRQINTLGDELCFVAKSTLGDELCFVAKSTLGDEINRRRKHSSLNVETIRRQKYFVARTFRLPTLVDEMIFVA